MLEVHCTGGWPLALSAVHRMFKRSNRFPQEHVGYERRRPDISVYFIPMNVTSQNPQPYQNIPSALPPLSPRDLSAVLLHAFRRSPSLPLFLFAPPDNRICGWNQSKRRLASTTCSRWGSSKSVVAYFFLVRTLDIGSLLYSQFEMQSRSDDYSSLVAFSSDL